MTAEPCPRCGASFQSVTVRHKIGRVTVWTVCPAGHAPHSNATPKPEPRRLEVVR